MCLLAATPPMARSGVSTRVVGSSIHVPPRLLLLLLPAPERLDTGATPAAVAVAIPGHARLGTKRRTRSLRGAPPMAVFWVPPPPCTYTTPPAPITSSAVSANCATRLWSSGPPRCIAAPPALPAAAAAAAAPGAPAAAAEVAAGEAVGAAERRSGVAVAAASPHRSRAKHSEVACPLHISTFTPCCRCCPCLAAVVPAASWAAVGASRLIMCWRTKP
mmetsp:Transcript_21440/g.55869  ORF Transcript_21440/g.55869 Transcript_21440/m.55869 type:complete len:218 (-) Transcript_21440:1336-1989(-)